jgi:hypothetical protein
MNEKIDMEYSLDIHYLTDIELRDFKVCSQNLLTKIDTIDTVLTYSKEFDNKSEWTIFKDLVAGGYNMYFDVSLNFKDKLKKVEYCFYDAGIFKDNIPLKNVPSGYINQIYFLKYDKSKKQYYGKIFGRGLDGSGSIKSNCIHELRIPPQTIPRKGEYGYWDSHFYIHAISKK